MRVERRLRRPDSSRIHDALREAIIACPSQGVLAVNSSSQIVFANTLLENLFGYLPGELVSAPLAQLLPIGHQRAHYGHLEYFFQDPQVRRMGEGREVTGKRKDGSEFPLEIALSPISTPAGEHLTIAFVSDISRRKQLEAAQRAMEERLSLSLEELQISAITAHVGIVEVDLETHAVSLSEEACRIFGRPADSLRRVEDLLAVLVDEDRPLMERRFSSQQQDASGLCQDQVRVLWPDGRRRWIRWTQQCLPRSLAGKSFPTRSIGACFDITEQKSVADALHLSQERMRIAVEGSELGVWTVDVASGRIEASEQARKLHGLPVTGPVTLESIWAAIHPEDRERLKNRLSAHGQATPVSGPIAIDYRVPSTDPVPGSVRWLALVGRFIADCGSAQGTYFGTLQDITARRRNEDRLRALTAQLLTAQEEERRLMARTLHDGVTQDLAVVGMELSLLRRRLTQSEGSEVLSRAEAALASIGDQLRLLSHEFHPGLLEHAGLCAALEAYCRELSDHDHMAIHFSADDFTDPIAPENSIVLYRIAQEALRNVVRHARAKSASVSLRRVARPDGRPGLCLSIMDDGQGFEVGQVERGAGLGMLSIAERARLIDGELRVLSGPGSGTRVEVECGLGWRKEES